MRWILAVVALVAFPACSGVDHAQVHTSNTLALHSLDKAEERMATVADQLGEDLVATQEAMILLELRLDIASAAADGALTDAELKAAFDAAQGKRTANVDPTRRKVQQIRTSVNLRNARRLLEAQGRVLGLGAAEDAAFQNLYRSILQGEPSDAR